MISLVLGIAAAAVVAGLGLAVAALVGQAILDGIEDACGGGDGNG